VKPVLLDTGVIVALLDRSERYHSRCAEAVTTLESSLITCEAVIAESCYLLRNLQGAPEAVIENVSAGIFQVPFVLKRSTREVKRILRKYRDREIDFADACLIALGNEFATGDILTLDRDFLVYRWGRHNAFRPLVPLN
jgi:uncharacterized protein